MQNYMRLKCIECGEWIKKNDRWLVVSVDCMISNDIFIDKEEKKEESNE